eukprot:1136784-Pelagomonas_calceolata.AAC.5
MNSLFRRMNRKQPINLHQQSGAHNKAFTRLERKGNAPQCTSELRAPQELSVHAGHSTFYDTL